eukprot:scaffold64039_cov50-Attheya_sp.AAC.3
MMKLTSSPKIMFDKKFSKRSSEEGEKRNCNSSAITTLKTTRHTSPGIQYSLAKFLFAKRDKDSSPSSETVSTDSNDDTTKLSADSLSRGTKSVKNTSKTVPPPPPPPPQVDDVSYDGQIDHVSSYGSSLEEEEDEDEVESATSEESNSHQAGDHQQLKLTCWPTLEAILSEKLESHEMLTSAAEPEHIHQEESDLGDEEHEFYEVYVQHLDTILENDEEGSSKTHKPSSEDSSSDGVATEKSTDSGYFSVSNSIASFFYPAPDETSSSERVSENYKDEPGFKIYMPVSETERLKWILMSSPLLVQKTSSREKARTKSLLGMNGIMIQHWKDNTTSSIQKEEDADGFWLPLEGPSPNLDNNIEFDLQIPWENQWEAFVPNFSPLVLPGLSDRNNHTDNENTGDNSVELPSAFDMTSIQEVHKSVQESLSEGRFESVLCMLKDNLLPALIRDNEKPCSAFCGILSIAATMKNVATLQMYLGLHREATAFLWEACIFSGISIASCEADNEDDENSDCIKLLKAYNMIYLMWLGISLCALEKYEDANMVFLKVLFILQGEKTRSDSTEADDERHKLMSRVLTNIGATFLEMRDYERAQRTLEKADVLDSNVHTRYLLKYCKYSGVSNRPNCSSPKLGSRRKLYTPGNNRSNEFS